MVRDEFLGAAGASGGGGNPTTPSDVVAFVLSNVIYLYQWSSSGFGAALTNAPITANGIVNGLCFSPDRTKLFYITDTNPYIFGYNITNSAVGSALATPAVLPSSQNNGRSDLVVSNNNNYIAIPQPTYPFITVYNLSPSGFGSKIADPSVTYPSGTSVGLSAAFSPDESALVLGIGGSSNGVYTAAWKWSSSGFGAKYSSDPNWGTNGFNNFCRGVRFSTDGTAIVGVINSDFNLPSSLSAWSWSYANGFGLKYTNPSTPVGGPDSTTRNVSVSANAVLATSAGPDGGVGPLNVYRWNTSTGFGAKYSYTAYNVGNSNQSDEARFSSTGDYIIAALYNTPLNFNPTNKLVGAFTFSAASGPAFFQYMPISQVGGGKYASFN